MSNPAVYVSRQLAADPNAVVREIGLRCLREYDEFAGMRYARLTAVDEERIAFAADVARAESDVTRAAMLEHGVQMIRSARDGRR